MSQSTKIPAGKNKKKKDPANRKRIIGAVIALIIVFTMLISVIEALFQSNSINPPPQISLNDRTVSIINI